VPGPLAGKTVIEVASFIAGPYAGMLLADLGAHVIKVEAPGHGDPFRGWDTGGESPAFWAYNRGKRSITLNLREPAGVEVVQRLVERADVLLENMRPGVMDRLGLGYQQVSAINPRLVYTSITGFGSSGPYRDRPAYDGIGQALSGLLSLLSERSAIQPIGPNFSDSLAGLFAAYGTLAALVARDQTGTGQHVETSLVAATLGFLVAPATETLSGGPSPGPLTRPTASQTYAWLASDGLPLTIHLSSPPKFWEGLTRATGRTELLDDPRFKSRQARRAHYAELRDELAAVFRTRPRHEWLERLTAHDVPCAPVYDLHEVFTDPQIEHMQLKTSMRRVGGAPMETVRSPLEYSASPSSPPAAPPELGEHTLSILADLGYTACDVERLRAGGAISSQEEHHT
jgi:crotonobetainyl-CoA:carnitine CoA-transferase CaiB-like acyl-CoA transferase